MQTSIPALVQHQLDEFKKDEVIISFSGHISASQIDRLLGHIEAYFDNNESFSAYKKRIFSLSVEILQNIEKHTYNEKSTSSFHLIKPSGKFVILSSNCVSKENYEILNEKLSRNISLNQSELKKEYIKRLDEGIINDSGGAGLGLIDILRRSGSSIKYDFEKVNEKVILFCLQVHVII